MPFDSHLHISLVSSYMLKVYEFSDWIQCIQKYCNSFHLASRFFLSQKVKSFWTISDFKLSTWSTSLRPFNALSNIFKPDSEHKLVCTDMIYVTSFTPADLTKFRNPRHDICHKQRLCKIIGTRVKFHFVNALMYVWF